MPHPLSYLTFSVGEGALRTLAASADPLVHVDGIETRNPSYAGRVRGARAAWLNQKVLHVAETGSSDAHHAKLVGTTWTDFDGNDGDGPPSRDRGSHDTAGRATLDARRAPGWGRDTAVALDGARPGEASEKTDPKRSDQ